MNIRTILQALERYYPAATAEEWDHVGLLVGTADGETGAVVTALDVTPAVIDAAQAAGARLIVSHHPVIFQPLSTLKTDSIPYRLAACGISVISLHTNLDKGAGGINDALAAAIGLQNVSVTADGLCRIGELAEALTARVLAQRIGAVLETAVRVCCPDRPVRRVGVCGGAGGDLALSEPVDAFVTGECKHHEWLAAEQAGVAVLDAGHHGTEKAAADILAQLLRREFPALTVIAHHTPAPYETV